MKWFLASLAIAGCASAGPGNNIIGGVPDAPTDAQVTLIQTASLEVTGINSFFCVAGAPNTTRSNSYYRVFALEDAGVTATLHVSAVMFGIQDALAGSGGAQRAKLNLGIYSAPPAGDTLDTSQIQSLGSADIQIPDGSNTRMTVPITADVAPGTNLIVELAIPADAQVKNLFHIGSNTQGERKPGYWQAPNCGLTDPTTTQSIGNAGNAAAIVMTVIGMQ